MNRIRTALFVALGLLSGCAVGQYHRGYHAIDGEVLGWGAVGRASVEPLAPFEDECVRDVMAYRLEALRARFAPGLAAQVSQERLRELSQRLRETHRLDGTSVRVLAVPQSRMLDEGVGKDAFRFYDFVGTRFALGGDDGALLTLFVGKIDGSPRLVGFEIGDRARSTDTTPLARFLVPESDDRAALRGRHHKIVN